MILHLPIAAVDIVADISYYVIIRFVMTKGFIFSELTSPDEANGVTPGILGLIGAALAAWLTFPGHDLQHGFPIIWASIVHIVLIVSVNALLVQACGSILNIEVDGVAHRSSAIAGWFAPLSAYLASGSTFGLALAAIVGFKTARWIYVSLPASQDDPPDKVEFGLLPNPSRSRVRWFIASAFVFEAMVATAAGGAVVAASVLALAAAAMIGSRFTKPAFARRPRLSRELISSGMTWIVAFMLTTRALGLAGGGGASDGGRVFAANGGTYWGVFLWLQTPPKPAVPPSPVRSSSLFASGVRTRVKIPFDGVYWFFRPPQTRPPGESVTAYGSPHETRFRSTDSTPILMEAHQTLAGHVDLTGCREVEVGIINSDRLPGSIGLEVVLTDSAEPFAQPLSLGISEAPPLSAMPALASAAREQTLRFRLPDSRQISSFDEITVRYHLGPSRQTESASIAVEYIVLVPSGG
jgi:hypothetical protein